ncbi:response regulator [Methylobrevis pamukkalensis]|uniref:Two-component response regulator n=1 Tax=Methylobrevis pamukkalensis TaxID=1439726 RepID=A0A1E3H2Q2_9HYPH|nr:response regulator [Methylobrevis pamukkalensis]ODN70086.1 two-component response regulator [Methylobrevis pamukkalensis]
MLIVEDEFFLAEDLSRYFRSMGAEILGPAANVEAAERQVSHADAAVLDVDLNGQKVFPVADELVRRGTPFIFFTGREDIAIPLRFRHVGLLSKPFNHNAVFEALFSRDAAGPADDAAEDDVFAALPKLRLAALLLMKNSGAADRLVELTLEQALTVTATRDRHDNLEAWLTSLLEETYTRTGRDLLV